MLCPLVHPMSIWTNVLVILKALDGYNHFACMYATSISGMHTFLLSFPYSALLCAPGNNVIS